MNSPTRVLPALLAFLVFAISAHATEAPAIRAGSELDFRPYCFTDNDGQATGFGVELLKAVADKMGLPMQITAAPWDQVWNDLVAGRLDVLPVVARTPGREPLVDFSLPHTETFDAFFVREGRPPLKSLADAAGKEIVVLREDAAHHQLIEQKFSGKIIAVESIPDGLRLVAAGRHEAFLCSKLIGALEIREHNIRGLNDGPLIPDYKRTFSFAVSKGHTELLEKLNQGLRIVKADGTYDRLYQKWLGLEKPPQWQIYFWRAIGILGVLVLIAVTWVVARKAVELDYRQSQALTPASRGVRSEFWRYALAIVVVGAGFALRIGLEAWAGRGLPLYITFYPAVMVAGLLGGLGPGLLATVLASFVVAYWILAPEGYAIGSPVDRVGMGFFIGMGVFMTAVAELYRRDRQKAAAYERQQALREGREALRRHAELIDPIRAELIAQEMQRVVRERGGAGKAEAGLEGGEALWRVPVMAGALVAAVGALVLVGWAFDLPALKSALSGLATMKANTALCFLFAGAALVLIGHRSTVRGKRPVVGMFLAAVVLVITGLTFAEYLTGVDFGIDQLLFRDTLDPHTVFAGRMVEATALGFLLVGASLLMIGAQSRAGRRCQQTLAVLAGVIGLIALLGYIYNVQQLYRFAGYSSMALPTAASLLALAIGLVLARHDGLGRVLTAPGPAAQFARRFLPVALLMPAALGWLVVQGHAQGFYGKGMDTALLALTMTLSLAALTWWTARALSRADATRRETEAQLRNQAELIDQAGEALIVREMDGAIRSWNRGAEKLYGWSAAEAVGQRVYDLLQIAPAAVAEFQRALGAVGQWEGELFHTNRDGRQLTIEAHKTATRTSDGRVLVLENLRDITEHKQSELALRESEERFRGIVETAEEGIATHAPDGTITYLNQRMADMLGYAPEEIVGRSSLDFVDDGQRQAVIQARESVRENGNFSAERKLRRKDGSILWTLSNVSPRRDGAGAVLGYLAMHTDITERKRAEEALLESRAALQQSHDELEQRVRERTAELSRANEQVQERAEQLALLASQLTLAEQRERRRISLLLHDHLQQLLVGAKFGTQILSQRLAEDDRPAAKQVQDLLDECIRESRALTVELSPPILHEAGLSAGLGWLARWMEEKHGLSVELQIETEAETDREDLRILLFQAVRELLFNVVKHAGVTQARVELARSGVDGLRVTVSDSGRGFDVERSLSGEAGSTGGFGLFSIRERVQLLGGCAELDSAPQRGTRISLIVPMSALPVAALPPPARPGAPQQRPTKSLIRAAKDGWRQRVLVVDDHNITRQGLVSLLGQEADVEIVGEAADGEEAVRLARELQPDVILMDFSMPRKNGLEATREIHAEHPGIRIIGLSMYEEAERSAAMRAAGAAAYLTKSGPPDALLRAIRERERRAVEACNP